MRERLNTDIDKSWPNREEKKEAIKALDPADMETEYNKYFPSE
jgi:hypothetical protein